MLLFYCALAFLLFFLQNMLPLPSQLRLDLLTLFIIFVSLRASFIVAITLALSIGTALDCYGLAPLGLHAGLLVIAVIGVEILRRHLNFLYIFPQLVGVATITMVQAMAMALFLNLLMPMPVLNPALIRQGLLQIGATTFAAPIILALFGWLENIWRQWFSIKI